MQIPDKVIYLLADTGGRVHRDELLGPVEREEIRDEEVSKETGEAKLHRVACMKQA